MFEHIPMAYSPTGDKQELPKAMVALQAVIVAALVEHPIAKEAVLLALAGVAHSPIDNKQEWPKVTVWPIPATIPSRHWYFGIHERLRLALAVFTGNADVLVWPGKTWGKYKIIRCTNLQCDMQDRCCEPSSSYCPRNKQ